MARRIGIKDVAAAAGVSTATVSHILNGVEGKRASAETRQRVLRVADELGYAPNGLARGLRLRRSQTIGFVSDEIATTPHASRTILGAQEAAAAEGLVLLLVNTSGDAELERTSIEMLLQRQVDGVLYAAMYHRNVRVPESLGSTPTVLLDARSEDPAIPFVVPDEVQGGYTAVRELIDHGHRRIGMTVQTVDVPARQGRLEGYRKALAEVGVPYDPSLVAAETAVSFGTTAGDVDAGYRAARRLLTAEQRPTALFCFNDRMAAGAYRAAAELGLSIPGDLSVIGFDNQELVCEVVHPALSTVQLPHYEMGARAVAQLLALTKTPGRPPGPDSQEMLLCPLVARASVASPPRL
ncbi:MULTISPECIES: LacI family DNA-binding transcriptional regulator [unclassified Streptomyces]|uniref:LacI family DNA-binding transcriptional regulator n=1 Tax=unclassified Streptomyces TaxID=2593676 RepID=UPI002366B99D|nr:MULTISPECIES: LacI family DNA-binding transcriptional regulator [unclassified Streptomyces]MDF3143440.1 LacI family DNA-binding transcriptional regulator [Streptomyces sp. T21Q-yed]WDF41261.1 LacI family DNA-binding transcriptional regulator [Streptomyces sp. T12]